VEGLLTGSGIEKVGGQWQHWHREAAFVRVSSRGLSQPFYGREIKLARAPLASTPAVILSVSSLAPYTGKTTTGDDRSGTFLAASGWPPLPPTGRCT
jgi:hypothetical protein